MWLVVVFRNLDEYLKDFLIIYILIGFNVCERNGIHTIHPGTKYGVDYGENHYENSSFI